MLFVGAPNDRQIFARADDRLVVLLYVMTAEYRYKELKVLVFGKEQGSIPNRYTKVLQVKAP